MRKVLRFLFWGIGMGIAPYSMAMELHPGRYSNETFDEPVVLCEPGQYKFNQCNFMIYDCDTGLRVHKRSDVVVNTCQFMGWGKYGNVGLGIFSESTLQVKNSYFSDLKYGLYYCNASGPPDTDNNLSNDQDIAMNQFENLNVGIRKCGSGKISIVGNSFTNNSESIVLGYDENGPATGIGIVIPQQAMLNMKCNSFITNELVARTGLVIENGVQVNGNGGNIGGNSDYDNSPGVININYPNANYFPIHDPTETIRISPPTGNQNVQAAWPDAISWQSIANQLINQVYYWRFLNEFVNNNLSPLPGTVTDPPSGQLAHTVNSTTNSVNPCIDYTNFPGTIIFPTRIAVDSSGVFTSLLPKKNGSVWLANPVPNPAFDLVKVGAYLPEAVRSAQLQILEAGTGKVIQSSRIMERGKIVIEFQVSTSPSGMYMYRIFYDGHISEAKKLVVSH